MFDDCGLYPYLKKTPSEILFSLDDSPKRLTLAKSQTFSKTRE